MSEVFLSYNSDDIKIVKEICSRLKNLGVDVWMDEDHVYGGNNWMKAAQRAINHSRVFVAIIGAGHTKEPQYFEFEKAINKSKRVDNKDFKIVPVSLKALKPSQIQKFPPQWQNNHIVEMIIGRATVPEAAMNKLIRSTTGRHSKTSILQTYEPERFDTQIENHTTPIEVYRLPIQSRSDVAKPLQLSWETFGRGIEVLREQIHHNLVDQGIDAFIGINDAGHAIATFLNFYYFKEIGRERKKVGYIKFSGLDDGGEIVDGPDIFQEDITKEPRILLVDFELKTGRGLEKTINTVEKYYENPRVYLAVFGSQVEDLAAFGPPIDDLTYWGSQENDYDSTDIRYGNLSDLTSYNKLNPLSLNGLLTACIMSKPGIQPPLGLR